MKKRIISAILMLIILLPILLIGGRVFAVSIAMIGVIAFKELVDLKECHNKIPDYIFLLGVIDLLLLIFSEFDGYSIAFGLTYRGIAFTILTMFIPTLFHKKESYGTKEALILSSSILFLGLVFNGVILIRNIDIFHFIYLILIVVLTDSFAMFIGKLIGQHKCCPKISPNKTWEGSIGGSIVATCIATIFYVKLIDSSLIRVLCFTLFLSIVGQLGDLFFSKIKRENKIKDFSNLIPGHGGVLDRIDSLIFVVLAYLAFFGLL